VIPLIITWRDVNPPSLPPSLPPYLRNACPHTPRQIGVHDRRGRVPQLQHVQDLRAGGREGGREGMSQGGFESRDGRREGGKGGRTLS